MSTVDLKSQIESLVNLQKVDTEIYSLRQEKEAKPEQVKVLEASFESKKQNLAGLEKKVLDFQKQIKEQELEIATKKESTVKLKTQLYSLKTNKEYQAMQQQIKDSEADASLIEDKILVLYDEIDKVKVETEKEKLKLKEEEKIFLEQKKVVEARVKEIDDRLAQLDAKRKQAIENINPTILVQYERILSNRDGLGIVPVKDNSCKGCNMHLPPQVINLIKMYEHLVTCETCNRILYVED